MNKSFVILVIGNQGQVGWELERALSPLGKVIGLDYPHIDLGNPDSILKTIRSIQPHALVNAAAITAVDKIETSPESAFAVNAIAPGILAEEAKKLNALFIHFSTDYVFDGSKETSYLENDFPNPLNIYGQTKLAGEKAVEEVDGTYITLRTSWVYGSRGHNFLLTMLRLAREKTHLKVVNDQMGAPTWARNLADLVSQLLGQYFNKLLGKDSSGLYHATAQGATSWQGFAEAIFSHYAILSKASQIEFPVPIVEGIPTSSYPTPAKRPLFSMLDSSKLFKTFNLMIPEWHQALNLCLTEVLHMEKYAKTLSVAKSYAFT